MKDVKVVGDKKWVLIETNSEAGQESRLSQTAVGAYFKHDLDKSADARYYALRDAAAPESATFVSIRVPGPDQDPTYGTLLKPIVVGRLNTDPYVDYAAEIAELSTEIGTDLPPSCFPYGSPDRFEAVMKI